MIKEIEKIEAKLNDILKDANKRDGALSKLEWDEGSKIIDLMGEIKSKAEQITYLMLKD